MKSIFYYTVAALIVVLLCVLMVRADSIPETLTEWGIYDATENGMVVNVREPLSTEKMGYGDGLASTSFDKATARATEEAKKLFRKLWDIQGVSNIRFSTYSVIIFKGRLYSWAELEPKITKEFEAWHATVKKPPATE